jgi:hypothetical protein
VIRHKAKDVTETQRDFLRELTQAEESDATPVKSRWPRMHNSSLRGRCPEHRFTKPGEHPKVYEATYKE